MTCAPLSLCPDSLPYIFTELRGLEEEVHVKRQPRFQHVLEPVETKTKQALVNPVSAVDEPGFALSNDKQTEAYHPDVGQACRNQEPTNADAVREMTFVNVKTTIFLVGEEGFDTKAALVEPAGPAAIGQIRDQVDGLGQSHLSHSLGLDRQIQALATGFGNPAGAKRAFRCPKVCPTL